MLEGFDLGARLRRGRSYARSGQVLEVVIEKAGPEYSNDETLDLPFCSGAVYRYFAVPEPVVEGPMAAAVAPAMAHRVLVPPWLPGAALRAPPPS